METKSQSEYIMDSFTCSSTLHTCYTDICPSVQSSRPDFKRFLCAERAEGKERKRNMQKNKEGRYNVRKERARKQSGHSEIPPDNLLLTH